MAPLPDISFSYDPSAADFSVSKRAYLDARPDSTFGYIATSVLVLDRPSASEPQVLLLQRAASDSNPNLWEPPGGACDDDDPSILYAAARELWEETGLQAGKFYGPIGNPHFFSLRKGGRVCRFNFLAQLRGDVSKPLAITLDPKEHQNFICATEDEVYAGKVGKISLVFTRDDVKRTVLEAFRLFKTSSL